MRALISAPNPVVASLTAIVTAVVLAVSGCAAPAAPVAETPAPTVTVTVTPTPTATPEGDFDATSLRGASIDSADFAALGAALGTPVSGIAECPWYAEIETYGPDASTYAFTDPEGVDPGILFFYTQDFSGGATGLPRTAEGVGAGSTQAEVLAAYPSAVVDTFDDISVGSMTRLTVEDAASGSRIVFALTDGSPVVNLVQWGPRAGTQWAHLCMPL